MVRQEFVCWNDHNPSSELKAYCDIPTFHIPHQTSDRSIRTEERERRWTLDPPSSSKVEYAAVRYNNWRKMEVKALVVQALVTGKCEL